MTSGILQSAISCVKSLQRDEIRDERLFDNPQNTSLVSAMSLLSNTAHYIQTVVNSCTYLFDIELLVLCRVKTSRHSEKETRPKHFVLWNTLLPIEGASQSPNRSGDERIPLQQENRSNIAGYQLDNRLREQTLTRVNALDMNNACPSTMPSTAAEDALASDAPPALEEQNISLDKPFSVPSKIAAECLHLLLDASGFSSHRNCFQQCSYANLGSKIIVEALRKVLDAEGKRRTSDGGEGSTVLPQNSTISSPTKQLRQSKAKTDLIYMDLLPDHLRCSQQKEKFALVPLIKIESPKKHSVIRQTKVSLNIRKPDRNKKCQNFAVLCILMHFTGQNGTCANVLREYAREGLSSEGCRRRMKFSARPNSNCGGFAACSSIKRSLCTFYNNKQARVGMGTVHPLLRDLNNRPVQPGEIVIRLAEVEKNAQIENNRHESDPFSMLHVTADRRVIWRKSLISRVALRADYGITIGTAILVENAMPGDLREVLSRCVQKKPRNQTNLDFTKAVVVCDVHLAPEAPTQFRYPYSEWYNVPSFTNLKTEHFGSDPVPDIFSDRDLSKLSAMLWHKDMIFAIENNEP